MQASPYISIRHRRIVVPMDTRFDKVISQDRRVQINGDVYFHLPHDEKNVASLAAAGVYVFGPIVYHYNFGRIKPFLAQRGATTLLTSHDRAYILSDLGTGKTLAALWSYDWLRAKKLAKRMLIVAPLSTLTDVWEREINHNLSYLSVGVLHGTKKKRLEVLNRQHDIYIINHDGVKVVFDALQARPDIDTICVDEIAAFRERRTDRWRALKKLADTRNRVWGMTGIPTPNMPTDAYAQALIVTPQNVKRTWGGFQQDTTIKTSQFVRVPKRGAEKLVAELLRPSVRYPLGDDIPPTTLSYRGVAMSPAGARRYKEMLDNYKLKNEDVTAANEGIKMFKLVQIASGFAYRSDGSAFFIDDTRAQGIKQILEECSGKVIIFCPYTELVRRVATVLGIDNIITGKTPAKQRDIIFNKFRYADEKYLVAHPRCMSHGLTLVEAKTIIWAAPYPSLDTFLQANGRIRRKGQTSHTHVIMVQGSAIERRIYDKLENNNKVQGVLLDYLEAQTAGANGANR